ncbi:probable ATP-dependent RNA helicase pitchoune isoform X2 [Cydia amplana]|uniref:probable ATP-dependent RNA helicase pitchoune isoform X2 n=1 Tax=Cydia amplana TaxID=1869771 RepID=UPI002FE66449
MYSLLIILCVIVHCIRMEVEDIIKGSSFSMLKGKVSNQLLENLKLLGFSKPTRIQAEALPYILLAKDIIGTAKTGSGKTLAFLIPVIERLIKLRFSSKHGTGCIILTPTRELALQIYQVLKKLLVNIDLTHSLIVGGEKKAKDYLVLKKGVNIVVSTPGRLFDHLQNTECFNVNNLKCLVVDEADKLLDAGFEKHITGIVKLLPRNRQTLLFSATLDGNVKNLARLALREDPVVISTSDQSQSTVTGLQQGYYITPVEQKLSWLYKMLRKSKKLKVMVFFSSCKSVDFHYEFFRNHCKATVLSIHGRQSQARRKEAYQKFVEASSGTLFCTDVAARGLDIPSVDWIVQYDPPTDPKLEDLILKNGVMKLLARKAYLSFLRCYKAHPLKKIFNINTLDINLAAKAFGFLETPHNDFLNKPKKKSKKKTTS